MIRPLSAQLNPRILMVALAMTWGVSAEKGWAQAQTNAAEQAALMAATYNEAMQAFGAGDWAKAASGLEKVVAFAASDPTLEGQMEGAWFTMGAAYFNMENHPKAIEVFQTYLKKYPNGARRTEAQSAIAQSMVASKQFKEALELYKRLEEVPSLRDQALYIQAFIHREQKKKDDEIKVLEKLVGTGELKSSWQARGALWLAELYADKKKTTEATITLNKVRAKPELIENIASLNALAVKLGDAFLDLKKYEEALAAYRAVLPREDIIKFQQERITMMERQLDLNMRGVAGDPQRLAQATMANNEIKARIAEAKKLLGDFEKLPDFSPALLYRMARVWHEWEKRWEAIVVYNRLILRYPNAEEKEPAMYSKVMALADLNQVASTKAACDEYLKEFPDHENASSVGYLAGAVALQAGDPVTAESFFGIMIDRVKDGGYRAQMRYLLGNAKFMQGKWQDAIKEYEKYMLDFPDGESFEDCTYRVAACQVFLGEYEKALENLNAYVKKYPQGLYLDDAKYRIAVCMYAAEQWDDVVKMCSDWEAQFGQGQIAGEVLSLKGDALAAAGRANEAIQAYIKSYKMATTDEVLNYSLFEASKLMQKERQWQEMSAMFEEFLREQPDHMAAVAALYWIGKAKAKLDKVDEAKEILVDTLRKYINDPKREAVEQILQQLVQLCMRRPRPADSLVEEVNARKPAAAGGAAEQPASGSTASAEAGTAAPSGSAENTAATAASSAAATPGMQPQWDALGELNRQLALLDSIANTTAKARMLYARSELAVMKKQPQEKEKIYREIAERFKPEDLSPPLLAHIGDFLMEKGEEQRAAALYEKLRADFLKSDYLDFAYCGLGEIAFRKKDYEEALKLFATAADEYGALKLREAYVGRAKTLLELGRFEESKKLFEQIASIREWRGDATAFAVYSLGEIEERQNRPNEAIAYYRRVFISYQKYVNWVAKSYLKTAENFDKQGKRQDAIDNLKEMLKNEKLQDLPETRQAAKLLEQWGAG